MAKNDIIKVFCFDTEIGVLGWDENRAVSYFQYNPDFLASNKYFNLIPKTGIITRVKEVQVFKKFNGETLRKLTGDETIDFEKFRKYCYYLSNDFIINTEGYDLYYRVMDCYYRWKEEGK